MSRSDRYYLEEQIEKELLANGVSTEEMENAKRDLHRFNMIDLYSPIFKRLRGLTDKKNKAFIEESNNISATSPSDQQMQAEKVKKKIEDGKKFYDDLESIISIKDFEAMTSVLDDLLKTCPIFTDDEKTGILRGLKEELSDFNYYGEHHQFRRLDIWLGSKN